MAIDRIGGVTGAYQPSNYDVPSTNNVVESVQETGSSTQNGDTSHQQKITIKDQEELKELFGDDKKAISDEEMAQELSDIKKRMGNTECKFGIDEATNRITIKIIDKESKKVIKEVPPEKTLKMIAKVWEMAGILVDEKL